MNKIESKVAIVSGASRGIGREICIQLAKQKAKIVTIAKNSKDLENLKNEIESFGGNCLPISADISNEQSIKQAVNKTIEQFGTIDILINNAGIGYFKPVDEITIEEWNSVYNVNVRGTFLLSK